MRWLPELQESPAASAFSHMHMVCISMGLQDMAYLWTSWWTFLLHPPCFQIWHLVNKTTIDMGVRLKTNLSNLTMSMLVVSMVALAHETTTPTKVTIQLLPILVYRESCPHLDIPQSWHSNRPHYVYTCNWTFDMSPLCSHIWHV